MAIGAGLFPAPNCFASDCHGNYRLTTTLPNTVNQQTYKLDQQLGRFGSVFFRYTTAKYENENINGRVSLPFGIGTFNEKSESWMISHTIPLSHNIVNNFRFGRLEPISIQAGIAAPDSDITALGLTGVFSNCLRMPACTRAFHFRGLTARLSAVRAMTSPRVTYRRGNLPIRFR